MTVFISGGAKNGKSSLAQEIALSLAKGVRRYYVATMIPSDEEDQERIRRHLADREGLGFETIECGKQILSCLEIAERSGTFLVDSATALLQNAMFPVEKHYELDAEAAHRCGEELVQFARSVCNAVIVSDYIYSDAARYDEATEAYRKSLAGLDRRLAEVSDTVIEMSAGNIIIHKGALPV